MSEGLKRIWSEISDETGWFEEMTRTSVAETTRETAKRLLDVIIPVEQIASATKLTAE